MKKLLIILSLFLVCPLAFSQGVQTYSNNLLGHIVNNTPNFTDTSVVIIAEKINTPDPKTYIIMDASYDSEGIFIAEQFKRSRELTPVAAVKFINRQLTGLSSSVDLLKIEYEGIKQKRDYYQILKDEILNP